MKVDHVLLIGFGSAETPADVEAFLQHVVRGRPIPAERLQKVRKHYEEIGGFSPYNAHTLRLAEKIALSLKDDEGQLPVFVGMRHWHPFLQDTLKQIQERGLRRGIGVILVPFRSEASWGRYKAAVREVQQALGCATADGGVPLKAGDAPEIEYLAPWFDHPLWIEAVSDLTRQTLYKASGKDGDAFVLFSTHSIPKAMSENKQEGDYVGEFFMASRLVADRLKLKRRECVYQSRSGDPREPWLGPDIEEVIANLARWGERSVVVVPLGFLCDNAEVLYDLDIAAKKAAEKVRMKFFRVPTVMDHPAFVQMLTQRIRAQAGLPAARESSTEYT